MTSDYKLKKAVLNKDQVIKITCKTPGIVVIDSISEEYPAKKGDIIKVSVGEYLNYIEI